MVTLIQPGALAPQLFCAVAQTCTEPAATLPKLTEMELPEPVKVAPDGTVHV